MLQHNLVSFSCETRLFAQVDSQHPDHVRQQQEVCSHRKVGLRQSLPPHGLRLHIQIFTYILKQKRGYNTYFKFDVTFWFIITSAASRPLTLESEGEDSLEKGNCRATSNWKWSRGWCDTVVHFFQEKSGKAEPFASCHFWPPQREHR